MSKVQNNKQSILLLIITAFAVFVSWRVISLGLAIILRKIIHKEHCSGELIIRKLYIVQRILL